MKRTRNVLAISLALFHYTYCPVAALLTPSPSTEKAFATGSKFQRKSAQNIDELLLQMAPYATMPLKNSVTFPPEVYTNPDLFELEKIKIFQPGWICVAHCSQVKNKGDYMTLDLLDERLLIVNNGDSIEVLSRVCTHRWASICETGKGSCSKFTCPMHRWSFDLQGECVGTPYMEDVSDFDRADHTLHKYRSEIVGGFVYVNIDGIAESLAPQISELTNWMENWETEDAEMFIQLEYECNFNWVRKGIQCTYQACLLTLPSPDCSENHD